MVINFIRSVYIGGRAIARGRGREKKATFLFAVGGNVGEPRFALFLFSYAACTLVLFIIVCFHFEGLKDSQLCCSSFAFYILCMTDFIKCSLPKQSLFCLN